MDLKLLSEINYQIEEGNMVDLPHTILEELNSNNKDPPYFFEITTESYLKSYVGVRQFTAEKDLIEIPNWLADQLGIVGNQILQVKLVNNIPKGKYIKLRPETEDFFELPDYESCLETKLSLFPILYQGQRIVLEIFDKKYEIVIEDVEQDWDNFDFTKDTTSLEYNVINVVDTDLDVDITNVFLRNRLEEEKRKQEEFERKLLEEKLRVEELERMRKEEDRIREQLLHEEQEKNALSSEELRLARLKFFENKN